MHETSEEKIINLELEKQDHYSIVRQQSKNENNKEVGYSVILNKATRLNRSKLPHLNICSNISSGLLGTIIFCFLFCSLLIWLIYDFESNF